MNYYGVYRGVVVNSRDPGGMGRVMVQVPSLGLESSWAPVCRPAGGAHASLPGGTAVLIAFEEGDPSYPVVLGRLS